ncbi:fimbria/pilus outer membrane usher protein [Pseudomonas sp. B21-032]|uniref:fimbria/pilus outer membrane usher protein n=1 Tax=Pseudomonas sp. B21-032 TaxID=2895483 RepID=UPI0021601F44|nr:fimbria/pilus outer membrane usher protein [Pseudomonas sp. B21-032]UVL62794.1 fimbria/pilus outer membrane usher protein [Pseudomonas sp. B21-032]
MATTPARSAWLPQGLLLWGCLQTTEVLAQDEQAKGAGSTALNFDADILRQRGIDPGLIEYLRAEARFTPGVQAVMLRVNDQPRGRINARFLADGRLCFDSSLLEAGGLKMPEKATEAKAGCEDFTGVYEQTLVQLDPAAAEVTLVVPTQALKATEQRQDLSAFESGGTAALVNYEGFASRNEFAGQGSGSWSLNTEMGFNAADWIVRSQQIHSAVDGRSTTQHLGAYAQRSFAELGTVLQAGQISLSNPVLAGARVNGLQLASEQALQVPTRRTVIDGIAQSQARVEVRQAGVLIYSTVVPPGPFALSALPQLDRRTDLEVTVIEASGEQRSFTVPSALVAVEVPAPGFVVGAGQVRDSRDSGHEPWVVSGGWTQAINSNATLSSGLIVAEDYHAVGGAIGLQTWSGAHTQWLVQSSQASVEGVRGLQAQLALSQRLGENWSLSAAATRQTSGYRSLHESQFISEAAGHPGGARDQYSAGLSWSQPWLGSLSATYGRSTRFDGSSTSRSSASWGQRFGQVSVSASAEWNLSGGDGLGNAVYLSLSMPLGERRRLRTSMRNSGGQSRVGVTLQEQLDETTSYRLGAERAGGDGELDLNAGVSLLPRHAQLDLNYTGYGNGNRSYSAGLRGGLLLDGGGATLSPYPLQDTFGVLSVGDVSGVEVSTPSGPVWTDGSGRAVLARLAPYAPSSVEVKTRSLPRNIDISNGAAVIQAGRGAVARVDFAAASTRRALLQATHVDGSALPVGAVVTDGEGEFVTLVQAGGLVFATNLENSPRLWVKVPDQPGCELHFSLADEPDLQTYYETTSAVCRTP